MRSVLGRSARAAWIAACTSRAAPLMSRLSRTGPRSARSPHSCVEVSSVTPAIVARRRSKGSATVAAMISGLAPGHVRLHDDDRKGDVRQRRHRQMEVGQHARQPDGDRQQCGRHGPLDEQRRDAHAGLSAAGRRGLASKPPRQAVEQEINHRRGEQASASGSRPDRR